MWLCFNKQNLKNNGDLSICSWVKIYSERQYDSFMDISWKHDWEYQLWVWSLSFSSAVLSSVLCSSSTFFSVAWILFCDFSSWDLDFSSSDARVVLSLESDSSLFFKVSTSELAVTLKCDHLRCWHLVWWKIWFRQWSAKLWIRKSLWARMFKLQKKTLPHQINIVGICKMTQPMA